MPTDVATAINTQTPTAAPTAAPTPHTTSTPTVTAPSTPVTRAPAPKPPVTQVTTNLTPTTVTTTNNPQNPPTVVAPPVSKPTAPTVTTPPATTAPAGTNSTESKPYDPNDPSAWFKTGGFDPFGQNDKDTGANLNKSAVYGIVSANKDNAAFGKDAATQQALSSGYQNASMGKDAADYLSKSQDAARGYAEQDAQRAMTSQAQGALAAAKTAGLNRGQAAMTAGQGSGQAYNAAYGQGIDRGLNQYNTATGMAQSQANTSAAQRAQSVSNSYTGSGLLSNIGNQYTNAGSATTANTNNAIGGTLSAALSTLPLFTSDERCKENILADKGAALDEMVKKVQAKRYNYKGQDTPRLGVMAQDLEKTPLADTVQADPATGTKMVDTGQLSLHNTALIVELAGQLRDAQKQIEALSKGAK